MKEEVMNVLNVFEKDNVGQLCTQWNMSALRGVLSQLCDKIETEYTERINNLNTNHQQVISTLSAQIESLKEEKE